VLFEDRDHLVNQSLRVIVASVLAVLRELADQSLVIGASLLQEKSVKIGTAGGLQFPFQLLLLRGLVTPLLMYRWAIIQMRAALLGHRNYRLIDIRMILDQLICISSNLAP